MVCCFYSTCFAASGALLHCSKMLVLDLQLQFTLVRTKILTGLTITFIQFVVTAFISYISYNLPRRKRSTLPIPRMRWVPQVLLFFTVNLMNNMAFGYNISVPVHIILRSGGSVLTMVVGFLWGKRYAKGQILGVVILTVGVIMAAMADAQSKVCTARTFYSGLSDECHRERWILLPAQQVWIERSLPGFRSSSSHKSSPP